MGASFARGDPVVQRAQKWKIKFSQLLLQQEAPQTLSLTLLETVIIGLDNRSRGTAGDKVVVMGERGRLCDRGQPSRSTFFQPQLSEIYQVSDFNQSETEIETKPFLLER